LKQICFLIPLKNKSPESPCRSPEPNRCRTHDARAKLFGRQRFNLQIVFVRFCFSALRRRISDSGAYLIPYQIDTVPSILFIAEFRFYAETAALNRLFIAEILVDRLCSRLARTHCGNNGSGSEHSVKRVIFIIRRPVRSHSHTPPPKQEQISKRQIIFNDLQQISRTEHLISKNDAPYRQNTKRWIPKNRHQLNLTTKARF